MEGIGSQKRVIEFVAGTSSRVNVRVSIVKIKDSLGKQKQNSNIVVVIQALF